MFIRDVIMNFLNYFCSLGIDMFHVHIYNIYKYGGREVRRIIQEDDW